MIRYTYIAETGAGTRTEFQVDEHDESIASVEAKQTVEQWLKEEGESPDRLIRFDLVSVRPI